eukprot:528684-Pelagomonas_calceolata.AAC.3
MIRGSTLQISNTAQTPIRGKDPYPAYKQPLPSMLVPISDSASIATETKQKQKFNLAHHLTFKVTSCVAGTIRNDYTIAPSGFSDREVTGARQCRAGGGECTRADAWLTTREILTSSFPLAPNLV